MAIMAPTAKKLLKATRPAGGRCMSLNSTDQALLPFSRAASRSHALTVRHHAAFLIRLGSMQLQLTAVFEKVQEGYIGFVEELPGANTQGETLEEARSNLAEAVRLVLEANRTLAEEALDGKDVIREPLRLPA
jgi:predicted RNase H-like HicB family nuclease